jgi:hypothetical protein
VDSLADILANKDYSLPDEVKAIKTFVADRYGCDVSVKITPKEIIVMSRSAGLIGNLRANAPDLEKAAGTNKKIRFLVA